MKNIKVNIINVQGKPSSTTLNYVICEAYYDKSTTTAEQVKHIKEYLTDSLRPQITSRAQEFTNAYIKKVQNDYGWLGVSQYGIEKDMISEIANSGDPF